MTLSTTSRLGLPRSSDDGDPAMERAELDGAMASLETNVAMASNGLRSARPAPGKGKRFYFADDEHRWYYDNGTAWVSQDLDPVTSTQINQPPFNATLTYVDFTSAAFPPLSGLVVPPSGKVWISMYAHIANTNSETSSCWAAWRVSGGFTDSGHGLSTEGSRVFGTARRLYTGLTPGATFTVTPQWNISSGNSSTADFGAGQLTVEFVV